MIRQHDKPTTLWSAFLLLLCLCVLSAIGVVLSTHESRLLLNEFQRLESQRNDLQVVWGQLLLEQSSLVAQGRVENVASTELGMMVPELEHIVVIKGE